MPLEPGASSPRSQTMHMRTRPAAVRTNLSRPLAARRSLEATRPGPRRQEQRSARPHVLDANVFKDVLIRERKRADRCNQPFVLLLASSDSGDASAAIGTAAIEALTMAIRETDVLGWFEQGTVLGVILTEIQALDAPIACE